MRWGTRPGLLIVDLSYGFTDPQSPLGADLTSVVVATRSILDIARMKGFPVVYTTIAFEPHLMDSGIWPQKAPALADLVIGQRGVEIDERVAPLDGEHVIVKKASSAFFGTDLATILLDLDVDTIVLCGASTSGCIRATAVDCCQYGWPALLPREAIGDRARGPHESNLFDIDQKYADVVSLGEVIDFLKACRSRPEG